jgi:hypothetical protein
MPQNAFQQMRPDGAEWHHVDPDPRAGQVVFRNAETGAEIACPSVWYNQPVEWRAKAMEFYAARNDECAKHWQTSADAWAPDQVAFFRAQSKRLRALADEMRATGKVLA